MSVVNLLDICKKYNIHMQTILEEFAIANGEAFEKFCQAKLDASNAVFSVWEVAYNKVTEHANSILAKHYTKSHAIYSAYKTDDDNNPVDNLDEVAIDEEHVRFVYGCLTDDVYVSGSFAYPTWGDLLIEFEKAIRFTGDYHHVFLESVSKNDKGEWELWSGS